MISQKSLSLSLYPLLANKTVFDYIHISMSITLSLFMLYVDIIITASICTFSSLFPTKTIFACFNQIYQKIYVDDGEKNRKKIKTWKIHLCKKIVYLFWDWFWLLNKQGMKPRRFQFTCGESLNSFKANRNWIESSS